MTAQWVSGCPGSDISLAIWTPVIPASRSRSASATRSAVHG